MKTKTRRKILHACLFAPLLLLAIFLILLALAATPWGLAQWTPALESRLSEQLELDVRIQDLRLRWPLGAHMHTFTATDAAGEVRLAFRKANVRISLRQLLLKRIRIYRVRADEVIFAGLPRQETETAPEPKAWEFPLRLPDVENILDRMEVHQAEIHRLVLAPPFLPETYVFSLNGQLRARNLSLEGNLHARGEKIFAAPPKIKTTVILNPFNPANTRDLDLAVQVKSFAKLVPNWPDDLHDTAQLHVLVQETRNQKLKIQTGELRSAPLQIELDGALSLKTGMLKLDAHASFPDLSRLQTWSPVPLTGTLLGELNLAGSIDDPEMTVTLRSEALQIAEHECRLLHVRYNGRLPTIAQEGNLEARVKYQNMPVRLDTDFSFLDRTIALQAFAFSAPELEITGNVSAQIDPPGVEGKISISASDFAPLGELFDMELTGNGRLQAAMSVDDGVQVLEIEALAMNWDDLEIAAESPLHIAMEPGHFRFQPWTLRVGRGRLLVAGGIKGTHPDLHMEILDLPLEIFGFAGQMDPGAELEGQVTLSGTLENPTATMHVDLHGLRPEDPELWDGPPARFRVELALREQRLQGEFRLEDLPGDPVTLNIDIPAPLSLSPFSFQWPPDGPLEAQFSANTDLAGIARLFVLDVYHRLVGTLAADIHLTGTFNDPRLDGTIRLDGGRYEHELSGTILSDIILEVAAERESLSLVNFSASDGASGTIQASGQMRFEPAARYPFETTLTLNRFRLMKNDQADAVGRGTLNWEGNLDESRLSGQVQVSPMTLNIPETLPPRLHALDVVEMHGTAEEIKERPEPEQPQGTLPTRRHRVAFDVRIDAPDRVFVRGRGLDSEWSARIQVRGQTPEPLLTGSLNVIRGRFSFFGKRLVLQRGVVTFDGAFPPAPLLDVEATLRAGGITGILRVQGPAADPEIELDSSPPLPEDEILARILFGREAARVTPWQAITLAQAVNKLRGGGSAFDLMGETRRVLGVDQIEVRTPDEEQAGTTITVGKYINDRVYVELERNLAEESGRAAVEVELTPSLRLETETGGNTDAGIGIIWTRDY